MGGSGSRFGGPLPKQFCRLVGTTGQGRQLPLFAQTLSAFLEKFDFDVVVLAVHPGYIDSVEFLEPLEWLKRQFDVQWVFMPGGDSRHDSFRKAFTALLQQLDEDQTESFRLMVHDANRPFLTEDFLQRVKESFVTLSEERPALIPVIAMADSVVKVKEKGVQEYTVREELGRVQTPQLLWGPAAAKALSQAQEGAEFPDEGSLMLHCGYNLSVFTGDLANRKITYRDEVEVEKPE